jgi:hypothetical protein
MLELYKGQIAINDIKYNMSYKEALLLREVRVNRLQKEREEIEREREIEAAKLKREQTRQSILKK